MDVDLWKLSELWMLADSVCVGTRTFITPSSMLSFYSEAGGFEIIIYCNL